MSIYSQRSKPKAAQKAVVFLYVSLALSLLQIVLEPPGHVHWPIFLPMFGVLFGFAILLIVMISRGRNWARITFLILFLVGLIPRCISLVHSLSVTSFSYLVQVAQLVSEIAALVLLFSRESSEWFKATEV